MFGCRTLSGSSLIGLSIKGLWFRVVVLVEGWIKNSGLI